MVVDTQVIEFRVREEVVLEESCWEARVGLTACHADQGDEGASDPLDCVRVLLRRGEGAEVVARRGRLEGGLDTLSAEGVDRHAIQDWRGQHLIFVDGFSSLRPR